MSESKNVASMLLNALNRRIFGFDFPQQIQSIRVIYLNKIITNFEKWFPAVFIWTDLQIFKCKCIQLNETRLWTVQILNETTMTNEQNAAKISNANVKFGEVREKLSVQIYQNKDHRKKLIIFATIR